MLHVHTRVRTVAHKRTESVYRLHSVSVGYTGTLELVFVLSIHLHVLHSYMYIVQKGLSYVSSCTYIHVHVWMCTLIKGVNKVYTYTCTYAQDYLDLMCLS